MISYTLKVTLTFGVFLINRPNKLILGIRGDYMFANAHSKTVIVL